MILEQNKISDFTASERQDMILCFGCYDLIHVGHITMFEELRKIASTLIICLANDALVTKLKGKNRPIIPESERILMLDSIKYVDYVFMQEQGNAIELKRKYNFDNKEILIWENFIYPLSLLKPGFCALSSEYILTSEVRQFCKDENIKIIEVPYHEQQSTSKIVSKILKQ